MTTRQTTAAWRKFERERRRRLEAINGAGAAAPGAWLCNPWGGDRVSVVTVGTDGYEAERIAEVVAGDADPRGMWNAAVISEAESMYRLLALMGEQKLTDGALNEDVLLAEVTAILTRVTAKAAALEAVAQDDTRRSDR